MQQGSSGEAAARLSAVLHLAANPAEVTGVVGVDTMQAAEPMAAAAAARITVAVAPGGRLSVEYPASAEALADEIFERKTELIAHLEALRTHNGEPVPEQVPSVLSVLSTATLPETFDTDPTGRRTCGVCRTPTARVGQSGSPLHGWCETGESPGRYLDRIARPSF